MEYRLERRGDSVVVVLHGGHLRAGLAWDEAVFADADVTVLAPSRPGCGRTPLSTGTTSAGFADVTAELCRHLGIDKVAAVLGIFLELGADWPAISEAIRVFLATEPRDLAERG
ncbi:hypothetical protein JMF97_09380 [Micromonospora fiedleri]|uniref:Alpha/beta hydrolase n=1 Tax=Micromonospora fiedleri TaxID=1157498 RepID=A0ABS1UN88_9ACTN|nr:MULTISPECIES: hypothetical protein [Micromonospora]MBL6276370.1 hypothetical protein [Micromonospora fiedleri]WSK40458.1 hypothetical protein OG712_18140 [Micromonospora maris]